MDFSKLIDNTINTLSEISKDCENEQIKTIELLTCKKWGLLPMEFSKNDNLSNGQNKNNGSNRKDNSWQGILDFNDITYSGDRIVQRLKFILNNIPNIKRVEYQIQFHQEIILVCLPIIYKKEWASKSSIILKKYGLSKYRPELFFITPRRFGKTMCLVMFACAALYSIPNVSINIFSTCKNIAGKLKNQIVKYLRQMPKIESLLKKCNENDVELMFSETDIRTVSCYSSVVRVFFSFFLLTSEKKT